MAISRQNIYGAMPFGITNAPFGQYIPPTTENVSLERMLPQLLFYNLPRISGAIYYDAVKAAVQRFYSADVLAGLFFG